MDIGIVGLPRSGKTTLFNAVTKGTAPVTGYSGKPNVGVAKVPDQRLDALAKMYQPRRVVPAEVTYIDLPAPPEGFGLSRGISGQYLSAMEAVDAILVVVRAFDRPSVAHIDETIDPWRDAENMLMELIFSDIEILDRRLTRIEEGFKSIKAHEREALTQEQNFLRQIREKLAAGIALQDQQLSTDQARRVSGFGLLSIKPLILVMNVGEAQLENKESLENQFAEFVSGKQAGTAVICAEQEMELTHMDPKEEQEFRQDLGSIESSLSRMVSVSYDVMSRISFFTVGEDEVRAWEITKGTAAQDAAGKIHSDLGRGFIRAEVMSWNNLVSCGGLGAARKQGILRHEGKDYIIQDGEIMHVLFNI